LLCTAFAHPAAGGAPFTPAPPPFTPEPPLPLSTPEPPSPDALLTPAAPPFTPEVPLFTPEVPLFAPELPLFTPEAPSGARRAATSAVLRRRRYSVRVRVLPCNNTGGGVGQDIIPEDASSGLTLNP